MKHRFQEATLWWILNCPLICDLVGFSKDKTNWWNSEKYEIKPTSAFCNYKKRYLISLLLYQISAYNAVQVQWYYIKFIAHIFQKSWTPRKCYFRTANSFLLAGCLAVAQCLCLLGDDKEACSDAQCFRDSKTHKIHRFRYHCFLCFLSQFIPLPQCNDTTINSNSTWIHLLPFVKFYIFH